jgi:hypothetical protein
VADRIFSASASGSRGRAPSQIELIAENISPEELARRKAEFRKRELIEAGRRGFDITMPDDFDTDTYAPWWVRVSDQTIWRREQGSPPDGYLPTTHCVVMTDSAEWYYLTAAPATGPDAPRSVAELHGERAGAKAARLRPGCEPKCELHPPR